MVCRLGRVAVSLWGWRSRRGWLQRPALGYCSVLPVVFALPVRVTGFWVCRRHMDSSTRHLCRLRSLEGPLRDLEGARLSLWPRCYSGAGWRVVLHPVASRYCDGYFVILSSFGATRFGPIAVLRIGIAASGARCAPRRLFARCSWASVSVACSTVRLGFRCELDQGRLVSSSRAGGGATQR